MGPISATEAHAALHAAHATQLSGLRAVFALAQDPSLSPARREVPDHLVDMITFEPMHDPVVTKNGHSYERATLYEHLKRSPTDPMTRESLGIEELRSNLGLRSACEEFWAGGAGEWIGDW
jgi:STIP1 family protein 1